MTTLPPNPTTKQRAEWCAAHNLPVNWLLIHHDEMLLIKIELQYREDFYWLLQHGRRWLRDRGNSHLDEVGPDDVREARLEDEERRNQQFRSYQP